jgi:hypothetical protein
MRASELNKFDIKLFCYEKAIDTNKTKSIDPVCSRSSQGLSDHIYSRPEDSYTETNTIGFEILMLRLIIPDGLNLSAA